MATLTVAEQIQQEIDNIRKTITDVDKIKETIIKERKDGQDVETKIGTWYIKDKTEYSFDAYFIYETGVTFNAPTYDEIVYDLKNRMYFLKRNNKLVNFSEDNLNKSFNNMSAEQMEFFETDGNKGFYQQTRGFGARDFERNQMISRQLIRLQEEYPALEFVFKAGIPVEQWANKYNTDFRFCNPKATNILDFFGFKWKAQLRLYKKFLGVKESRKYGYSNSSRYPHTGHFRYIKEYTLEDCDFVKNIFDLTEKFNKKYGINKTEKVLEWFNLNSSDWLYANDESHRIWTVGGSKPQDIKIRPYMKAMKDIVKDVERFIEYAFYEMDVKYACESVPLYTDYLRMAEQIGGKFNRYPAYPQTAHDVMAKFYRLLDNSDCIQEFNKAVAVLKDYEEDIRGTDYSIVAPVDMQDIIKEGQDLSHCVKSYIPSIANRETSIVFLRKTASKDESLYTIEVQDGAVVQAKGLQNCPLDKDAEDALNKWAKDCMLEICYRD